MIRERHQSTLAFKYAAPSCVRIAVLTIVSFHRSLSPLDPQAAAEERALEDAARKKVPAIVSILLRSSERAALLLLKMGAAFTLHYPCC